MLPPYAQNLEQCEMLYSKHCRSLLTARTHAVLHLQFQCVMFALENPLL